MPRLISFPSGPWIPLDRALFEQISKVRFRCPGQGERDSAYPARWPAFLAPASPVRMTWAPEKLARMNPDSYSLRIKSNYSGVQHRGDTTTIAAQNHDGGFVLRKRAEQIVKFRRAMDTIAVDAVNQITWEESFFRLRSRLDF